MKRHLYSLLAVAFLLAIAMLPFEASAKVNKVLVCHQPGTPAQQELTVPDAAVPGHLGHGDTLGTCLALPGPPPVEPPVPPVEPPVPPVEPPVPPVESPVPPVEPPVPPVESPVPPVEPPVPPVEPPVPPVEPPAPPVEPPAPPVEPPVPPVEPPVPPVESPVPPVEPPVPPVEPPVPPVEPPVPPVEPPVPPVEPPVPPVEPPVPPVEPQPPSKPAPPTQPEPELPLVVEAPEFTYPMCESDCIEAHVVQLIAEPTKVPVTVFIDSLKADVPDYYAHMDDLFGAPFDAHLVLEVIRRCAAIPGVYHCTVASWTKLDPVQ